MTVHIATLCLSAGILMSPAHAAGQRSAPVQQLTNATELDPDDPRARRASGLVSLLLAEGIAAAEKYLNTHAAPGSPAATDVPRQIKELKAAVADGFVVNRIVEARDGEVMVGLVSAAPERGGRTGIVVQVEPTAPHRIRNVRLAQTRRIQGGS